MSKVGWVLVRIEGETTEESLCEVESDGGCVRSDQNENCNPDCCVNVRLSGIPPYKAAWQCSSRKPMEAA